MNAQMSLDELLAANNKNSVNYISVEELHEIYSKEDIVILYRGFYEKENEWREIYWRHGDRHLFYYEILPLLEQEWTYKADISDFEIY